MEYEFDYFYLQLLIKISWSNSFVQKWTSEQYAKCIWWEAVNGGSTDSAYMVRVGCCPLSGGVGSSAGPSCRAELVAPPAQRDSAAVTSTRGATYTWAMKASSFQTHKTLLGGRNSCQSVWRTSKKKLTGLSQRVYQKQRNTTLEHLLLRLVLS